MQLEALDKIFAIGIQELWTESDEETNAIDWSQYNAAMGGAKTGKVCPTSEKLMFG